MLKYVTLGLLCAVATLLAFGNCGVLTGYTDCGSTGKIKEVRVSSCTGSSCILKKKTNVTLEIDFQPKVSTSVLTINMSGVLSPKIPPVPWHGVDENACGNTTDASGSPACPVKDGNSVLHYKSSFKVLAMYPSMSLTVKVTIKGAAEKILVCFTFPVKIES